MEEIETVQEPEKKVVEYKGSKYELGAESWQVTAGDIIVVEKGLEKVLRKEPTQTWETIIVTEFGRYFGFEILDYGKKISD